ncbi:MAG TPA: prepilin-type N-terminal cleavage/methylation domain-containing protein [Thermoanaerobaculia bacterium]
MPAFHQRGYTLLEIVVAMAVFGVFLMILAQLTTEMRSHEKRLPVNMHKHPMVISVLTRLRRDVLDGYGVRPYKNEHDGYVSSPKVLIIETVNNSGGSETVVWDFRTPGEVRRRAYNVGNANEWVARGLPLDFSQLEIDAVKTGSGAAWATRIIAKDKKGQLAIDTILQPRATE